jgi:hypothetical protein
MPPPPSTPEGLAAEEAALEAELNKVRPVIKTCVKIMTMRFTLMLIPLQAGAAGLGERESPRSGVLVECNNVRLSWGVDCGVGGSETSPYSEALTSCLVLQLR